MKSDVLKKRRLYYENERRLANLSLQLTAMTRELEILKNQFHLLANDEYNGQYRRVDNEITTEV